MIKLIASDLDGTLIPPNHSRPTDKTLELIHKLSLKGVHFISASGRQYASQKNVFGPLSNEISFISESGAICVHNDRIIYNQSLSNNTAYKIIKKILKDNKYDMIISCLNKCFIENKHPEFQSLITNALQNSFEIIDDLTTINEPVYKIALYDNYNNYENFIKYMNDLKKEYGKDVKIITSGSKWMDFICKDVNKGNALEKFIKLFNVSKEQCVVFGDEYNDVEMLSLIPNSFAMNTCAKGVEKFASYQTESVEIILEKILYALP